MILILLAGILPAVILVAMGKTRYCKRDETEGFTDWIRFLSSGFAFLVGALVLSLAVFREAGSLLAILLLPSICTLFAEICLSSIKLTAGLLRAGALPGLRRVAGLLLLVPVMLAALGWLGDPYLLQTILFGGALLAFGWLVWQGPGRGSGWGYMVLLVLMVAAVWTTDARKDIPFLPANLIFWLAPGLGVIYSFRLAGWALDTDQGPGPRRWLLAGLLLAPVLLLLAWQAATASAWDVATDGLGGVVMLQIATLFGVAAAIHQSWGYSPAKSAFSFGLVALILAIVSGANTFGTFGQGGEWGTVPRTRTSNRAAMIDRAILRYHADNGRYPESLDELKPGYLLYMPTPFIIPLQDWCYQGGTDYYRFGYVYRDYFSSPASVKVFAAAGLPPDSSWECEAEAARYPGPPG